MVPQQTTDTVGEDQSTSATITNGLELNARDAARPAIRPVTHPLLEPTFTGVAGCVSSM